MKKFLTILSVCTLVLCSVCSCSDKGDTSGNDSAYTNPTNEAKLDEAVLEPIHNYLDGFNKKDCELILSSFTPKAFIDEMKEKGIYEDEIARTQSDLDSTHEMWQENFGDNSAISFEGEVSNSTLSPEYLEYAEKYFELTYYDLDSEIELEEGYEITYKYKITGDSGMNSGEQTACHVKVKDDGWMLIFCDAKMLENYKEPEKSEESESESEETAD